MSEPLAQPSRHLPRSALASLAGVTLGAWILALASFTVTGLSSAGPIAAPSVAAAQESPPLDEPAIPVRIRVSSLGIDLPVVSSERNVPGNRRDYPLCDVAQYWAIYDLPGAPGTTWIYAHAQPGMFLPLLETAVATNGRGLIGKHITLQLRDDRLLRYRIEDVKQHAVNRRIARRSGPNQHRLVLQTSEGPPGTVPKLQVAARLVSATVTDEPVPRARPRACWQQRASGGRPGSSGQGTPASQAPSDTRDSVADTVSLAVGGGAVLLGATILAVYLVRRPPTTARRRT